MPRYRLYATLPVYTDGLPQDLDALREQARTRANFLWRTAGGVCLRSTPITVNLHTHLPRGRVTFVSTLNAYHDETAPTPEDALIHARQGPWWITGTDETIPNPSELTYSHYEILQQVNVA